MVAQDHFASVQANLVTHGLHFLFGCDGGEVNSLVSAKAPKELWAIGSSVDPSRFPRPFYLAGGDAMPTAGSKTATLSGSIQPGDTLRSTFRAVPVGSDGVAGTLADGPFHDVEVETDVQTAMTMTTAVLAHKVNINIAIAGTGSPVNGRIRVPTNKKANLADIGIGMALKYAACTVSGPILTYVGAASGGVVQNNYNIMTEVVAKPPGLVTNATDLFPALAGCFFVGATLDPVLNLAGTEAVIDCGQSYLPIDQYLTATAGDMAGTYLEDANIKTNRLAQQIADEFSTNNYKGFIPNFNMSGPSASIIMLTDSQDFPGNPDITVIRNARSNSLVLGFKKSHTPVPFKFTFIKGAAQDLIYQARYRPSINA
jgi:hypothetical protein